MGWLDALFDGFKAAKERQSANNIADVLPAMVFKDAVSAVEYSNKYLDTTLRAERMLPALVLDARMEFGVPDAVKVTPTGEQTCVLRVSSSDGGFLVVAQTSHSSGPRLEPGNLVAWLPLTYRADLVPADADSRFGWIGLIVGKLDLEFDIKLGWKGGQRFG